MSLLLVQLFYTCIMHEWFCCLRAFTPHRAILFRQLNCMRYGVITKRKVASESTVQYSISICGTVLADASSVAAIEISAAAARCRFLARRPVAWYGAPLPLHVRSCDSGGATLQQASCVARGCGDGARHWANHTTGTCR